MACDQAELQCYRATHYQKLCREENLIKMEINTTDSVMSE